MKVLVTGGAGYIGSTVCSALLDRGIQPVILDNLVTGREQFTEGRTFYRGDIADGALLDEIFEKHPDIGVAIHCAAVDRGARVGRQPAQVLPRERLEVGRPARPPAPQRLRPDPVQLVGRHVPPG
jgi:UDP-glucose 4-epimerase